MTKDQAKHFAETYVKLRKRMNTDRLLCKAKRVDNGEWITGFFIKTNLYGVHNVIRSKIGTGEIIDPNTLCQCTGLKDRNGTLIFEGDVIETFDNWKNNVVEWDDSCCRFEIVQYSGELAMIVHPLLEEIAAEYEVITNIHDKGGDS